MDAWYASLKQMQQEAEAGSEEAAKTFAAQKPEFEQKQEQLIREEDAALEELENAFSFMENAFPEGQEMVVFVTELTMGGDSMAFFAGQSLRDLSKIQPAVYGREQTCRAFGRA